MELAAQNPSSSSSEDIVSSEITPQPISSDESHGWNLHEDLSVDPNDDDDSAIGGFSETSATHSARASVFELVNDVDGRRYHRYRQGKYMMPSDELEQDRLNMQHQLWLMTLDEKLNLAPLKKEPLHVLDLGTGTGVWAIDFATEYPTASVIGSDLSPIQPDFIPANCTFEVDDFEDEWTYTQRFDLIHGRLLVSCISNPKRFFEQALASLAPGGFLEMQDGIMPLLSNDSTLDGTALAHWCESIVKGAKVLGRDIGMTRNYKKWMEEVGFVNVEEKVFNWPMNTWPKHPHMKKLGYWGAHDLIKLITNLKVPLMRGLGWSLEEVEKAQIEAKKDVWNRKIHSYFPLRVVYGMKPE